LKLRLMPYFYTLSRLAHDTGLPPVRAMAMEFPQDLSTFSNHTGSAQQFMAGPFFLVAPVYRPFAESSMRDGIYLPAGLWVDYWSGEVTSGPMVLDSYPAPLSKLPLFIRSGAIIPMWPDMAYVGQLPADPLTLDIYPSGESSFELYEDDGHTREALEANKSTRTLITCNAPPDALLGQRGTTSISIAAAVGHHRGKLRTRSYKLAVHLPKAPASVMLADGETPLKLVQHPSMASLDFHKDGWAFQGDDLGGIVHIRTTSHSTATSLRLDLLPPAMALPRPAGSVSCGAHWAAVCSECPQGHGEAWCNGDCGWWNGICQSADWPRRLSKFPEIFL